MKKYDLDEVFSYDTFKVVRVKDRRLGLLFRSFQLAIFAYILFTIIKNKSYLKKEPPIPGAIRVTLQAPPALTNPPYCGPAQGQTPCVYWGENEIQYPSDGAGFAFFTTRASVTNYPPPEGCSFLAASSPDSPCIFDPKKNTGKIIVPKSYIANIEDYSVMIEHSIRGKVTDISSLRNGLMDGKLKGQEDNDIKTFSNATRAATDSKADGDILTVKDILDAAGVDLDAPSFAPGADPGEINRSSGVVIVILIEYKNVAFKADTIKYNYRPQVIDGGEYKAIENIYNADGSYTIVNRHGIRLVFQQTGEIGEFEFVALLVNLVAALALFKVATTIVEILMLKFLPEKKVYEGFKFEETHDFGDYRSGVLGDTEIAGSNNSQPKQS